jgi:hypothetical protein
MKKGPQEQEKFFSQLQQTYDECRRHSVAVFIGGDWNSKLGLRTPKGRDEEEEKFMGNFGKGTRNKNGDRLAMFLVANNLYAANTHFQHSMRHRSTWGGAIKDRATGALKQYFNQIDYILVDQQLKSGLRDSRAYNGQDFNSDHSLVVTRIDISAVFKQIWIRNGQATTEHRCAGPGPKAGKRRDGVSKTLDISLLGSNDEVRRRYGEIVGFSIQDTRYTGREQQGRNLPEILEAAATTALPESQKKFNGRPNYFQDEELARLSSQQKKLREKIRGREGGTRQATDKLRKERSALIQRIRTRVAQLREQSITKLARELEKTPDSRRKFEVARIFRQKSRTAFQLKDSNGLMTQSTPKLLEIVTEHYKAFFNPTNTESIQLWGEYEKSALAEKIRPTEVLVAMKKLSNGRSIGPDGIPGELYKYAGEAAAAVLAEDFNQMFEDQVLMVTLIEGLLVPLNKPGKEHVKEHTRPITLLNAVRKILSLVAVERMREPVAQFVGLSQCGFRQGRSTAEVAWGFAWLKASAWRYRRAIHVVGIDMSKAFDMVLRGKLMVVLEEICSPSVCRIVRVLIAQIRLRVTILREVGEIFFTYLGTPQGDGLSPVLFIIYLEAASREIRALDAGLYGFRLFSRWGEDTTEMAYADDLDFLATSKEVLDELVETISRRFLPWNLLVNVSKTERHTIHPNMREKTIYKKLGTKVDPDADVEYRKVTAGAVFQSLWKIWHRELHTVSSKARVHLYNAIVKPTLLYNIQAIPLTETRMRKLEAVHRRHLRQLLKIFWPKRITVAKLYQLAETCSIRRDIWERKLKFLKHALQQPRNSPARECMEQYYRHFNEAPRPRGNPLTIQKEMQQALQLDGRDFRTWGHLSELQKFASTDPSGWEEMSTRIVDQIMSQAAAGEQKRREKRHTRAAERSRIRPRADETTTNPDEPPTIRWSGSRPEQEIGNQRESTLAAPTVSCTDISLAGRLVIRLTGLRGMRRRIASTANDPVIPPPRMRRVRSIRFSMVEEDGSVRVSQPLERPPTPEPNPQEPEERSTSQSNLGSDRRSQKKRRAMEMAEFQRGTSDQQREIRRPRRDDTRLMEVSGRTF